MPYLTVFRTVLSRTNFWSFMHPSLIKCINTPNTFFELEVNSYVLPGQPLTLVDTGIGTEKAWIALLQGLEKIGFQIEDIQQIVLTHKHPDHFGLARRIQRISGARVFIHKFDLADILDFPEKHESRVLRTLERCRSSGVPDNLINMCKPAIEFAGKMAESVEAEPLQEGQILPINGQDLEILHTPGHTIGSVCLRYGKTIITGDHVLPHYTPNIGGSDWENPSLLLKFFKSLERLRSLCDKSLDVLPGHGPPIKRLSDRLDHIINHHKFRNIQILKILETGGKMTSWEVASQLFGDMQGIHVFLGLGEVEAHFRYLENQGKIKFSNGNYSLA